MIQDGMLSVVWLIDSIRSGERISLLAVRRALRATVSRYELVLATRDVANVARHFIGADPHLRVVVPDRRGESAALSAACAVASGDYILPIVGDAMPDWDALPALAPFLERSDVIAAYGGARDAAMTGNPLREALPGFLFGVTLREPLSPTKLYRAELLRGLSFVSAGAGLQLELAAKARAQGAIVTEVAVADANDASVASGSVRLAPVGRLWLHLRRFHPQWTVRVQPAGRTPSEYVLGGLVLATVLWLVRGRFVRWQK